MGCVVSFDVKNDVVFFFLLAGFHSVRIFFVLLAWLVECWLVGSVGLVVL